jgi:predicted dehydrogenase
VKPLNIAIVGAGRMGWIFAHALHQMPQQARVAHVVSRSLDSAAKMGDYFACPFGKTLETALPHVDAVVIAAATPAHADLAIACAQAGKPFFVEKPIADTLENGRRIVRTLEQHPVLNMVGFHRRFDPAYSRAKQHIEGGKLGQLEVFRSISRDASMGSSSLEFHLASGGLIVDLGVHDMDLARWLMGEVQQVQALGGALTDPSLAAHGLHDTAVAILHFKSGAFGSIEMARNTAYGHEVRTEVLGAKGKISLERDQRFELTIYDASGGHFDRPRGFEERFAAAYLCEMSAFVQAILAGQTQMLPDAKDAWHSLRLAMAAQEALNTGKTIVVDSFGGTL